MKDLFVGIDTSNYTTSLALADGDGNILANLKAPLPVKDGECGLRQSDAVFAHVKNLPELFAQFEKIPLPESRVLAVGVSAWPRRQENSYMPCFLSGVAAATAFAVSCKAPLYRFSHQEGHMMAAIASSGAGEKLLKNPFAAFHVSGGTTDVLYAVPDTEGFQITHLGESLDLHAGQAVDRAGVLMGLPFPCGAGLEALAKDYKGKLPPVKVSVDGCNCHLSGLQNQAEKLWNESRDQSRVSAFVLAFLGKTLQKMTCGVDALYPNIPIVYAGGVMSNRYLQTLLSNRENSYFAEPQYSADNAAGIALLCRRKYLEGEN